MHSLQQPQPLQQAQHAQQAQQTQQVQHAQQTQPTQAGVQGSGGMVDASRKNLLMLGILEVLMREVLNPASSKETRDAAHSCLEVMPAALRCARLAAIMSLCDVVGQCCVPPQKGIVCCAGNALCCSAQSCAVATLYFDRLLQCNVVAVLRHAVLRYEFTTQSSVRCCFAVLFYVILATDHCSIMAASH